MSKEYKLIINGLTYSVLFAEYVDDSSTSKKYGICNSCKQEIRISNHYSEQRQSQTLIHELLHACIYESGLGHMFSSDDAEENFVNTITPALTGVIKQLLEPNSIINQKKGGRSP